MQISATLQSLFSLFLLRSFSPLSVFVRSFAETSANEPVFKRQYKNKYMASNKNMMKQLMRTILNS